VIAALENSGGKWIASLMPENQELEQYISNLEAHIGAFAQKAISEAPAAPVPVPDPPQA
jgi:hypothetical protein